MRDPVAQRTHSYTYDATGALHTDTATTLALDNTDQPLDVQTTTTGYDPLGRMASTVVTGPDSSIRHSEALTYDPDSNIAARTTTTNPTNGGGTTQTLEFTYDRHSQLTFPCQGVGRIFGSGKLRVAGSA